LAEVQQSPNPTKILRECENNQNSRERFGVRRCSGAFVLRSGELNSNVKVHWFLLLSALKKALTEDNEGNEEA